MLGVKWDHKLQMWVVFVTNTGKVVEKYDSEKLAKRALSRLRSDGEEEKLSKRHRY